MLLETMMLHTSLLLANMFHVLDKLMLLRLMAMKMLLVERNLKYSMLEIDAMVNLMRLTKMMPMKMMLKYSLAIDLNF